MVTIHVAVITISMTTAAITAPAIIPAITLPDKPDGGGSTDGIGLGEAVERIQYIVLIAIAVYVPSVLIETVVVLVDMRPVVIAGNTNTVEKTKHACSIIMVAYCSIVVDWVVLFY